MELGFPIVGRNYPCPHCNVVVRFGPAPYVDLAGPTKLAGSTRIGTSMGAALPNHQNLFAEAASCPHCGMTVIVMYSTAQPLSTWFAWPLGVRRQEVPTAVPATIASKFREAVMVLPMSPTASAAIARRCLQHLLREQGYAQHDLVAQINAALPDLPKPLRADVDLVRVVGNFAAHPTKGTAPDSIVDVEDGEAEWMLEVIEELFGHFYVRPEESSRRKASVNAMLTAAGKKPLP